MHTSKLRSTDKIVVWSGLCFTKLLKTVTELLTRPRIRMVICLDEMFTHEHPAQLPAGIEDSGGLLRVVRFPHQLGEGLD